MQYEQLQMQLDYPVMRRQVTEIHRGDDGYITYATSDGDGVWKQWHYLMADLVEYLQTLPPNVRSINQYISINSFRRPQRSIDYLWHLNALYIDVDYHDAGAPENASETLLEALERDVFGHDLPIPSFVTKSGRGLQIVWIIKHLPRQAIPFWAVSQEAVKRRIDGYVGRYPGARPTVDNCADIARVFRLCGSYNTKAGKMAEMIAYADTPAEYRLDQLRDRWFPELKYTTPKKKKSEAPPTPQQHHVKWLFNQYTLHMARRDDLYALLKMRQEQDLPEDCRRRMVFLCRYWSCCATRDPASSLETALEFNGRFHNPLPERTVVAETQSAERAYVQWKQYNDLPDEQKANTRPAGYNYKNETLIKWLGITEEEQRRLKTIIGKQVKYARRNERAAEEHWRHDKRDGRDGQGTTAKQRKLREEREYARRLSQMGMSQRQIAQAMECSVYKVNNLLNR